MIYSYGFSIKGKAHEKKDIVCQDSNYIKNVNDDICIAAVADGLGSEMRSDIASKLSSQTAVEYCSKYIELGMSKKKIISIIKESFNQALMKIEEKAKQDEEDILQYDTTLSLCVFICGQLYYGHSGDSGIIALTDDGLFHKITDQQRDNEGRVYPLAFGDDYWKFDSYKGKVVGVLMATDGILDLFYPVYLRFCNVNIYTSLAKYFLNLSLVEKENFDIDLFKESRYKYVFNIPENIVDDDKTVVAVMYDGIKINWQNEEYYKEPDWIELKNKYRDEYNKKAYLED